jgi:hypothetical protein
MRANERSVVPGRGQNEDNMNTVGRLSHRDRPAFGLTFAHDLLQAAYPALDFKENDVLTTFEANVGRSAARARNRGLHRGLPSRVAPAQMALDQLSMRGVINERLTGGVDADPELASK